MNKIQNIIIVGGGTSGWMTASSLIKNFPNKNITLISSEEIGTIGVGESTIGSMNTYLDSLGIPDEDWMKCCNATYKTSINFTNFCGDGKTVKYPFGVATFLNKYKSVDWFLKKAILGGSNSEYVDFAIGSSQLIEENKLTKDDPNITGWNFKEDTAYHIDATLFGKYLKDKQAIPMGVVQLEDTIIDIEQNEDGSIKNILTKDNGKFVADLYIDCTGFYSLFLGKTLKEPFISFRDKLINDKAVATHINYKNKDKELLHNTDANAINNGWVWNTPLWNSIGTGYVYSSKFLTEQEAEKEFKEYLINDRNIPRSREEIERCEMRHVRMTPGIHERSWVKNVCAVGLSNGFIEPLESTGLMLITETIFNVVKTLKIRDGKVNSYDKSLFNNAVRKSMSSFSGFVAAHYALAEKNDTPYWKYVTEEIDYMDNSSKEWDYLINFLPSAGEIGPFWPNLSSASPSPYIMAGFGWNPIEPNSEKESEEKAFCNKLKKDIENSKLSKKEYVNRLPNHYQFLKNTIYQGME